MSAEAIERVTDIAVADELIESAGLAGSDSDNELGAAAVRVVKGNPSDEEIAALVAVLTAAASAAVPVADNRPPELWGTPASMHRTYAPYSPYSFAASSRY